jgi:hypothetical protein
MQTFTVEVRVPDDLREQFEARVRTHGGDQNRYLSEVLERDLRHGATEEGLSISELLSLASGPSPADRMTDDELTEFAEGEVKAYRREKRVSRA